jgi:hypothetical protein
VFKHREMSVNIESLMVEQGRPPEATLTDYPGNFLTSILAGNVRQFQFPIIKDNEPPNDPAHGLVLVEKKAANRFANSMLATHQWIVQPPNVPPPAGID